MLDVHGAVAQQHVPLTGEGTEVPDLLRGTERCVQESVTVQLLDPLTIEHIGFLFDGFQMAGIDQTDLDAVRFQDIVHGNPIDAGGFHGNAGDAAATEPGRKLVQVTGERPKGAYRFRVTIRGHRDIDLR